MPDAIGRLEKLKNFDVSINELKTLPSSLCQLSELVSFSVARNRLTALPDSFATLVRLVGLDLSNNELDVLPESLISLAESGKLSRLFLHGNDVLGLPTEILGSTSTEAQRDDTAPGGKEVRAKPQEPARIARYLRQLTAGPTRPLREAKLLVVGPGGHGKSSLIEFLRSGTFVKGRPSTEGVEVGRWDIADSATRAALRLNVWDFGGQEIQYSTHEFFLTERAVYLLVFQPRDDLATPQGLYQWLDLIHLVSPDAPVVVALSKQDEFKNAPVYPNDMTDLKRLHDKIVDFIPISCDEDHVCAEGARRVRDTVAATACREIGHVNYKLPAAWMAIKEQLENGSADYLTYALYTELCRKYGVNDEDDQELLADFLHALGTMLNYSDRLPLEQTNILKPGGVTDGVYAVALSPELKAARGIIDEHLLGSLLGDPRHEGRYPPAAQRFILQMMLSFKLCYELRGTETTRRYLVPNALPDDLPTAHNLDGDAPLRFEIHFPRILPTSVISRFIVAMHEAPENAWRLGMRGQLMGHEFLVTAHPKERRIRIAIGGVGPLRIRALEVIRHHFAMILREREYGAREYTFPPNHPHAKPYPFESLLKAEREQKREIWLDDAGDVNVRDWLDGVTDPWVRSEQQRAFALAAGSGERGVILANTVYLGDDMSNTHQTAVTTGAVSGNVAAAAGQNVTQTQTADIDQRVQQLAGNPQEVLRELSQLRALISGAAHRGADRDDCENAVDAVSQLEEAVTHSDASSAKKAKRALTMLKGLAEGFKAYADIAESFDKVLKYVGPAVTLIAGS